jgi:outer membrane receptor protein involved in Fe transport
MGRSGGPTGARAARWPRAVLGWIGLALCACGSARAQDATGAGSISGSVTDEARVAAPGVKVCVVNATRCAVTGQTGAFHLMDLRAADYLLEISAPGRPVIVSDWIAVRAGLDQRVEVTLPEALDLAESVRVTATAVSAPDEVKTSAYLLTSADIFASAGALQDVSRYVQSLPGVVIGSNDFRNDIIVRGGSPLENLFLVDNVEVPNINTFANFASAGGTVSILDTAMIRDVTFLTGGYPAPYANRTSSVLQIAQRDGDRERLRGTATLGFAGAGGVLEGPLGGGRGSWITSVRRSFLDFFTKDVGFGGVPVLYTVNSRATYDLGPRDRLWAVNVAGVDRIRLGLTDDRPPDTEVFNFDIRYQGWRTATGLNWQHLFGGRGVGLLGVTHSEARVDSTVKDLARDGAPPIGIPAEVVIAASPLVFEEHSREGESTLKYDLTTSLPRLGTLQAGGSVKRFDISYDTASPLGDDSPYSATRGVNAFALARGLQAWQYGAYAQWSRDLTPRLNLTAGARLDAYRYLEQRRLSPRAGVSYRLADRLTASASYGRYAQQPPFLFVAAFPENRALAPIEADHYVGGVAYTPAPTVRVSVEAYRKNYRDYPVATQFPSLSLANLGDTFNVRALLFPLTSAGAGQAYGVELSAERRRTERWYGVANLALSRTRHAGLDGVLRPGSFDYPVVLNVTAGRRLGSRWDAAMKFSYLGGRPYTPFDERQSRAQDRGILDLTRVNDVRAPAYVRLDLRIDRTITIGGSSAVIFAGAQNITNRRNFAGYTWNRRTNAADFTTQLGLFPLAGLEWKF